MGASCEPQETVFTYNCLSKTSEALQVTEETMKPDTVKDSKL